MDFSRDTLFRSQRPKRSKAITITPLIDIAFFLLIFFMVAGSIQQFEVVEIEPPFASNAKPVEQSPLVILLGSRNEIVIDDLLLSMDELDGRIAAHLAMDSEQVVTIKADRAVKAQSVLEVMEMVERSGGQHVSIATEAMQGSE